MADVTGAPVPLMLAGKEYWMSPLDDTDVEQLNNWLRSSIIKLAVTALDDNMPQRVRDELMAAGLKQAREVSWLSGDGAKVMATLDGVSRVVWHSLVKKHPELTHEDTRKLIMDPITLRYAMALFKELNVGDEEKTSPKNLKRRRVRR